MLLLFILFTVQITALHCCEERKWDKIIIKCFENIIEYCLQEDFNVDKIEKKLIFNDNIKRENVKIDCENKNEFDFVFNELSYENKRNGQNC